MSSDTAVEIVLFAFSTILAISGYFMKRTVERLEAENRAMQDEMKEMKGNYIARFEELGRLLSDSHAEVLKELGRGAVIFAEIRKDVEQIKAWCTVRLLPPTHLPPSQ